MSDEKQKRTWNFKLGLDSLANAVVWLVILYMIFYGDPLFWLR